MPPKTIVLIGFMGSGKSAVGRRLGTRLGRAFIDLDAEIVREAGLSIPRIFELHGERAFRRIETRVLSKVLRRPGVVVAAGGGVLGTAGNRARLRRARKVGCAVVWLDPQWAVLWARLKKEDHRRRPLLADGAGGRRPEGEIKALWRARRTIYERAATVRVKIGRGERVAGTSRRVVLSLC